MMEGTNLLTEESPGREILKEEAMRLARKAEIGRVTAEDLIKFLTKSMAVDEGEVLRTDGGEVIAQTSVVVDVVEAEEELIQALDLVGLGEEPSLPGREGAKKMIMLLNRTGGLKGEDLINERGIKHIYRLFGVEGKG